MMMTKKLANTAFFYAILSMIGGVFYREFTKLNGFTGVTRLSFVHLHLMVLGMFFFLLVLLLEKPYSLSKHKSFGKFYMLYNVGLCGQVAMLVVRGIPEALSAPLTGAASAAVSGIAGITHMLLGGAIIWFFSILKKSLVA